MCGKTSGVDGSNPRQAPVGMDETSLEYWLDKPAIPTGAENIYIYIHICVCVCVVDHVAFMRASCDFWP